MVLFFVTSLILAHGPTIPPDPWAGGGTPPCESTPSDPCFM